MAQKLGTRSVGIDVAPLAIALMRYRLCAKHLDVQLEVVGEPMDLGDAIHLRVIQHYLCSRGELCALQHFLRMTR